MAKLLLLGIVLYSAIVPLLFATTSAPKRAVRNLWILHLIGVVVWSYLALVKYPIYVPLSEQTPKWQ